MKKTFVVIVLFLSSSLVLSQPSQPPGDPSGDPDNPVPLYGIGWLLAAGGAYGARKLLKTRKSQPGDHR